MKKNKLKLKDIEVESFVTNLEEREKETVDGGASLGPICTVILTTAVHSVLFGNCVTGGGGVLCKPVPLPEPPSPACSALQRWSCHGTLGA